MFVVSRPDGAWELRQSFLSQAGPRARTLARFRVLTPDVLAHADSRVGGRIDREAVRQAAERAGAPIADDASTAAARTLVAEIAKDAGPPAHWRRLLAAVLGSAAPPQQLLDSERAALPWMNATPAERGRALTDLLALADAIPASPARTGSRRPRLRYPRLGAGANRDSAARR